MVDSSRCRCAVVSLRQAPPPPSRSCRRSQRPWPSSPGSRQGARAPSMASAASSAREPEPLGFAAAWCSWEGRLSTEHCRCLCRRPAPRGLLLDLASLTRRRRGFRWRPELVAADWARLWLGRARGWLVPLLPLLFETWKVQIIISWCQKRVAIEFNGRRKKGFQYAVFQVSIRICRSICWYQLLFIYPLAKHDQILRKGRRAHPKIPIGN
jgi:hypothetical protein